MALDEYNFVKYDPNQMEHLERHLEGSHVQGSHFKRGAFPDAKTLVDFALQHIQDYNGQRTVVEVDLDHIVGYDSVVSTEDLPESATVTKEPRGRNEYLANVIDGAAKKPTNHMVIVAGPLKEQGKHGFYTIFPGQNTPPFPATEEQLREWGYKDAELQKAAEENKQYAAFWETHGFVRENQRE